MVTEKLDALERALSGILEELHSLRGSRMELESQLEQVKEEAKAASDAARDRAAEVTRLQTENDRLQKEHSEIRERVERILKHIG